MYYEKCIKERKRIFRINSKAMLQRWRVINETATVLTRIKISRTINDETLAISKFVECLCVANTSEQADCEY